MTGIERRRRYGKIVPVVLSGFDISAMAAAYIVASLLMSASQAQLWLSGAVIAPALLAWIPAGWRLFARSRYRALKMERTATDAVHAAGCHALIFIALLYITATDGVAWDSLCYFYASALVLLPLSRTIARSLLKLFRRRGRNYSRVVIVGNNDTASRLLEQLNYDPGFGYKVLAVFDQSHPDGCIGDIYYGAIGELDRYVRENRIDEIFCTLPGDDQQGLRAAISAADANGAQYYYVPQMSRYVACGFALDTLGNMAVMPVCRPPLDNFTARTAKRALDIAVATVGAILFPLIFVPVAIAIKTSSKGPVFYRQTRTGYMGKPFSCLKFRTMRYNPADESPVEKNDPRVTAVGKFLRHSSLDELPQIFNVLVGNMSVVGPRPHMVSHTEYYREIIDRYMLRHSVKPGITGWAQVNGYRGTTDHLWKMERRVEHDVWYIENWSFMLDLKIIVRTAINMLAGDENAY